MNREREREASLTRANKLSNDQAGPCRTFDAQPHRLTRKRGTTFVSRDILRLDTQSM